jgi:hypothetical protein
MSLAMFAASFDDNSNITLPNNLDTSENILNQKRHKRTQRKYPKIENFDTNKVNSVLEKIHNTTDDDNDDDDDKFTFNPPPKPESMSGLRTIPTQQNKINESFTIPLGKTIGRAPVPNYEGSDNLDLNDYSNYGDSKTVEEYYKSILPGYNQQKNVINKSHINRPHYPEAQNNLNEYPTQDILLKKLNYMISLLEEQQDEKTSNVTEEVILYSFLGIFIIFIADTFVRAGKYTR